jgi:membrane-associated phospholipid phosphatase
MISWAVFTKLADTNFTMPVAALLACWLAGARAWKPFFQWCFLFGTGIFLVLATKIAYVGWGIGIAAIDFKGFSGHAMRAATLAPPIAYFLTQRQTFHVRQIGLLIGVAFAVAICISRLVLGVHSISEAITGLVLGLMIPFSFILICNQKPVIARNPGVLAIGLIILLPALAAKPAPTSSWIERTAIHLAGEEHAEEIKVRAGTKH